MSNKPGLIIKPRDADYKLGINSPLNFPVVLTSGDWRSHQCFNENQRNPNFDNDGCACYWANKELDTWMDFLISNGTIAGDLLNQITQLGFMDSNSKDGKSHFHSSPRFTENLTGNGINGNSLPECLDVIRKYGAIPWSSLPFTPTMTQDEYFQPIPQNLLDVGANFLNLMGGKNFLQYHWLANGSPKDIQAMAKASQQTPLGIGIAVTDGYNQVTPTDPPASQEPGHALFVGYVAPPNTYPNDNYIPYDKILDAGYPINYVMQARVAPIIVPPLPAPLPTQPNNAQISNWLTKVSSWVSALLTIFSYKGIPESQKVAPSEIDGTLNTMNAKVKAALYGVISLVGNGAILAVLPDPYKVYAFLGFNLLQVVYAFFDPSYHIQILSGQNKPQA